MELRYAQLESRTIEVQPEDTILYVGRHGSTLEDETNKFCGWTNSPMTDKGRAELTDLISYMNGVNIEGVYSSDLDRASEGAQMVAAAKGKQVVKLFNLRTWGIGSELTGQIKTPERVALKKSYVANKDKMPLGTDAESINQSAARQLSAVAYILTMTQPGKANFAMAHSSLMKVVSKAMGNEKLHLGPGGLARIIVNAKGVVFETLLPGADRDDAARSRILEIMRGIK